MQIIVLARVSHYDFLYAAPAIFDELTSYARKPSDLLNS